MTNLFTEESKVLRVEAATAAGTGTITTAAIDMTQDGGYGDVTFILATGALVATTDVDFIVQAANESNFSDGKDVGDALAIADDDDNHAIAITVRNPPGRYVALSITRAVANATIGDIFAVLTRPRNVPVIYADTDDTITHEVVNGAMGASLTAQQA